MPIMQMKHDIDPVQALRDQFVDVDVLEPFNNQVLIAIYLRPSVTAGGIHLVDRTRDEDKTQGKVGLIVKHGKSAFVDPEGKWFDGIEVGINDWVAFKPSDGWYITLQSKDGKGVLCKVIEDVLLRGKVKHPDGAF